MMETGPEPSVDVGGDDNRGLKRKHPDSTIEDTPDVSSATQGQSVAAAQNLAASAQVGAPMKSFKMESAAGFLGLGSILDFSTLQRGAEAVLFSRAYQPYLFNPTIPTGYSFGGMRLEMFRTDTIGGSVGDIYFVCVESYFNTAGPLGLKLTLSTQGWLLANSGNMTEKNEHLGPGIDFFVDDMLLSINGNNLVGLELSEVVKIIGSSSAPRKLLTCRFFKSIPGALAWMVKIWSARKDSKVPIALSANYDTSNGEGKAIE